MDRSHHSAPLEHLDEAAVLASHGADPLSYASHDFWPQPDYQPWPSLMVLHAVCLTLAFFIVLPIAISLRSVRHAWHGVTLTVFHVLLNVGVLSAALYTRVTPDLYEGSSHARTGYSLLALVVALTIADAAGFIQRVVSLVCQPPRPFSPRAVWRVVFPGTSAQAGVSEEYSRLVGNSDDVRGDREDADLEAPGKGSASGHRRSYSGSGHSIDSHWVESPLYSPTSNHSDLTLHESHLSHHVSRPLKAKNLKARLSAFGNGLFHVTEHALVVLAFAQSISGVTIYTGTCRGNYTNGCLAHLIKGGIFWVYGLVTFARYLGAFASFGWAWNRRPAHSRAPSAEALESSVILFYGVTNTWMERFGAAPGSPYTAKQVQHISIAVMFWFAGLVGLALESRRLRRWLDPDADERDERPPMNPLPALVIGVTGLAMSAHHQEYVFQVQVHRLWGAMLAAFAVLRWLTYFLLWTRRAARTRPPTETLASFFLACGGLVFVMSMEQIGFFAMRHGHDDIMMFMNLAVAITCFAFAWVLGILAVNGYVKSRAAARAQRRSSH